MNLWNRCLGKGNSVKPGAMWDLQPTVQQARNVDLVPIPSLFNFAWPERLVHLSSVCCSSALRADPCVARAPIVLLI